MKIATWNVNSVRARLDRLLRWLEANRPDVLCLQELKVTDEAFPLEAISGAGYRAVVHGQKTYNGVAILALEGPGEVQRTLGDDVEDPQARYISASVGGLRVASVYVPNGGEMGSEKWAYKLEWLRRLRVHLETRHDPGEALVLCGDLNVAFTENDVHDPDLWEDTVLFHPEVRRAFEPVLKWGLIDTLRLHHRGEGPFTWWDYRRLAFPQNHGLRIDHILATAPIAERCASVVVDRNERKGKQPSDHAPVVAELRDL